MMNDDFFSIENEVHKNYKEDKKNKKYLTLPKNIPLFTEEPGEIKIDILPYVVNEHNHPDKNKNYGVAVYGGLWYKRPFLLHKNIGSHNESVVCPEISGADCPICNYKKLLISRGVSHSDEFLKSLIPSNRNLYYIIPVDNKNHKETPHVWEISQNSFQKVFDESFWELLNMVNDFADLHYGKTININFNEKEYNGHRFCHASNITFEKRYIDYDDSTLDMLPSLDSLLNILNYNQIESIFFDNNNVDFFKKYEDNTRESVKTVKFNLDIVRKPVEVANTTTEMHYEQPRAVEIQEDYQCKYGYDFGIDADEKDECATCTIWEKCVLKRDTFENL